MQQPKRSAYQAAHHARPSIQTGEQGHEGDKQIPIIAGIVVSAVVVLVVGVSLIMLGGKAPNTRVISGSASANTAAIAQVESESQGSVGSSASQATDSEEKAGGGTTVVTEADLPSDSVGSLNDGSDGSGGQARSTDNAKDSSGDSGSTSGSVPAAKDTHGSKSDGADQNEPSSPSEGGNGTEGGDQPEQGGYGKGDDTPGFGAIVD